MEFEEINGLLLPKKQEEQPPKEWSISIAISDFSPRKVTAEELAKHEAERQSVIAVCEVLTKINKLLAKNKLSLYQSEGDYDVGYTPSISIGCYTTTIDNETGLFELPSIPEKWDENTMVQFHMPMPYESAIYTFAHLP